MMDLKLVLGRCTLLKFILGPTPAISRRLELIVTPLLLLLVRLVVPLSLLGCWPGRSGLIVVHGIGWLLNPAAVAPTSAVVAAVVVVIVQAAASGLGAIRADHRDAVHGSEFRVARVEDELDELCLDVDLVPLGLKAALSALKFWTLSICQENENIAVSERVSE